MTHLSDEELEWITNRHIGEKMLFLSQDGTKDTITISNMKIWNSIDSIDWYYYTTSNGEYHASASVDLYISSRKGEDVFYIHKGSSDEPVCFGAEMFGKWTPASHLADTCMQIGSHLVDDIVLFKEEYMRIIKNQKQPPIPIVSYAWSKKYGLVQYTFQDGTTFSRIDLR